MFELITNFPLDEVSAKIYEEFRAFLVSYDPEMANFQIPPLTKAKLLSKGDFTVLLKGVLARRKLNVETYTTDLVAKLLEDLASKPGTLIQNAKAESGFINLFVNRELIFREGIRSVLRLGDKFGTSEVKAGKKIIVEHTSSNPNGPLHIGNLRNTILGAHLSKLFSSVGYEVKQHFFVNDLGAQIGYTALGYRLVYPHIKPYLKIDQWIGIIYAIMNTLAELQSSGVELGEYLEKLRKKEEIVVTAKEGEEKKVFDKRLEFTSILVDLHARHPVLTDYLLDACSSITVKKTAAELNLQYERNEPEAVLLFRSMVINCLSGVQQTFDIYNVKHDQYDFESELGWEGSNDRILNILRSCPYFVPQTQSNSEGVPEGGHFLLDRYIYNANLPVGKKGYMKDYPKFYLLRPDGSTLYTFRDVVYSVKKCGNADMVFNIIASEQNLPQEKVALSLRLLNPLAERKQFHLSYELVKLTKGKMSGRRAQYVLADYVYDELREKVKEFMIKKRQEARNQRLKDEILDDNTLDVTSAEVATSAMKFTLLSTPPRHEIKFDIEKAADPEAASNAPFILYNATRLISVFRIYEDGVASGLYPALPPVDEIDFTVLDQSEWSLLIEYILYFPTLVLSVATPDIPPAPQLPDFSTNKICDFCLNLANETSSYYNNHKILKTEEDQHAVMFARLYLCRALLLLFKNSLDMLTIKVVDRM